MDIIYLSETYFNSSVPVDDDDLQIPGSCFVRADHLSNTKHRGVPI